MEMQTPQPKTDKREYTFMIIPHRGTQVYSWSIPIKIIKKIGTMLACCLCIFTLIMSYQGYKSYKLLKDSAELADLRANRAAQEQKLNDLAKAAGDIQKQINEIDKLEMEVKKALGENGSTQVSRSGVDRGNKDIGNGKGGPASLSSDVLMVQIGNLKNELDKKQDNLKELRELLDVRNQRARATPSIWPTDGSITSRFGYRSSPWGIGSTYHNGLDIANAEGSPIYATADGVVTMSEWNGGYGRYIEIDHGYGIVTAYGHNSQNLVTPGERVKRGQVIGYVGNTGNSTGAHCHYEVRINGQEVDPTRFIM